MTRFWISIEKELTCPSNREAKGLPLPATVGLFVPVVVNANAPVGFGGLRTFRASRRTSAPNLRVCLPRTIVSVSRNSVVEVVKLEFAAVVGPICWKPATVKIGKTEPNEFEGSPGTVIPPFWREAWYRSRLEYPKRNWVSVAEESVRL